MGKIIEASELPLEEKIYLKKDFLGWRVVDTVIDPSTKKIVWKNLFNKKGLLMLLFLLFLMGAIYMAYKEQIRNYQTVINNPCYFCTDCKEKNIKVLTAYGKDYSPSIDISWGDVIDEGD